MIYKAKGKIARLVAIVLILTSLIFAYFFGRAAGKLTGMEECREILQSIDVSATRD